MLTHLKMVQERWSCFETDLGKQRDRTQNKDTKKDVEEDDSKVIDKQWQNFISLSATASRDNDELGFQNSNMNSGNKREDVLTWVRPSILFVKILM